MATTHINGVDHFYEVTGDGFPVVWCHEFAGGYRSWDPQVEFFARLYCNVTYNYRGFPPSAVPTDPAAYSQEQLVEDLRGLLDHLAVARGHLVGLSMGGNVVLNFALKYPHRCRSIVVAGCGAGTVNREQFERDAHHTIAVFRNEGMEAVAAFYTKGPARLPLLRKNPKGWQVFRDQFVQHSALGSALTQQGVQLKRPTIFSLKEQLNRLAVPTLLLVGDEDEPCIEPGLFMKREIPSAGLMFLPQSGHAINLEEPALFNETVLNFFHFVEAGKWAKRGEVTTSMLPAEQRQ